MSAITNTDWDANVPWDGLAEEALERLRAYVRIPTVNDPNAHEGEPAWRAGDETEAASWLAGLLQDEGIEHELLEAAPGRFNLVAHLRADRPAASSITLLSHSDVVPVVPGEWDVDPFAAEIHDGYLYGRGVLDLKGLGIAQLTAMLLLRRLEVPLERDLRLLIVGDEETGGTYGAEWLLRERPELLDTSLVLGEGAFSPTGVLPGGAALHTISVAEKGYLELELTVNGSPHHASMPDPDSAPAVLVRAVQRILANPEPIRITEPTARLCACLADSVSGLHRLVLRRPRLMERMGGGPLRSNPLVAPMVTQTCALTVLSSGYKANVVPGHASAVLSLRLLTGSTAEGVIERLRRVAAEPTLEIRQVMHKAPNESPFDTPDFATLAAGAVRGDDSARATPILSPGASDARHWRAAGVPSYGWIPFTLPAADIHGMHGSNERVSVSSFQQGLLRYCQVLQDLATSAPSRPAAKKSATTLEESHDRRR